MGFVDGIWVDISYRKRGIGKEMVGILKGILEHHGVKFIILFPSYLSAASCWKVEKEEDENWRPWDADEQQNDCGSKVGREGFCRFNRKFESSYDVGDNLSKAFWRACGARRIGLKPWFGIALEESHPANKLLSIKDAEDIHCRTDGMGCHTSV